MAVTMTFSLNEETAKLLEDLARVSGENKSELLRRLILEERARALPVSMETAAEIAEHAETGA